MKEEWEYCEECKRKFNDSFEFVDHFFEKSNEEFDPALVLPNGFKLMIGSLLRFIYKHADNEDTVKHLTQSVYITLFAADRDLDIVAEFVENMVVKTEMDKFDLSLKKLLEKENKNGKGDE